ncbi:MAG: hypothetical protein M3N47_08150 [Chloroflexota bacterium]|nr:hypothetical protein [Chloroflexota bacterium]
MPAFDAVQKRRVARGGLRACVDAFRVIAANPVPDHATIARFPHRHEDAALRDSHVKGVCGHGDLIVRGDSR